MPELPTGTVTFLFTDIEGSTALWERAPDAMRLTLGRHDALVAEAIEQNGGIVVKNRGEGDSVFAVFARPTDAVASARALQLAMLGEAWPAETPIRVRAALHTGEAEFRDGDYYGSTVNRCARLRAIGHGGQTLLSAGIQELVRDHLPPGIVLRDLGEHRLRDLVRPERVFELNAPGLPAEFRPLRSLDTRPHNLPVQPKPLIGRERELAELHRLLRRDDVRLVTLTGPGGTGKTRLALQAAADSIDRFADGVFLVQLASLADPELVVSTMVQALGAMQSGSQPLVDALIGFLRDRSTLLLLDNFEQIVAAAPTVSNLLARCPTLKVLVTSRVRLQVRGEHEFAVSPLPVPTETETQRLGGARSAEALSHYAAVALFIERAIELKPDFAVTNENAPAVAEICRRLDGLPLAIELAAARIKLLSPASLLGRLQSRLHLLTGGPRDLPARQQTLRRTIAWSYDLLQPAEQALFRRLSVFTGGLSLEAAEAVASAGRDLDVDVLDGVAALVDNSLLRQVEGVDGETRFVMLETIREFGLEALAASGEEPLVRRRHAEHFLGLARAGDPHLAAGTREQWRPRLEQELDNFRSALAWCEADASARVLGLDLAVALRWFWASTGNWPEGRGRLETAVSLVRPLEAEALSVQLLLGRALCLLGLFAVYCGDFEVARDRLSEARAYSRHETAEWRGYSAQILGVAELGLGHLAAARAALEASLGIFRSINLGWMIAQALIGLGDVARCEGDHGQARARYEEARSAFEAAGQFIGVASSLHNLGRVALREGDRVGAAIALTDALNRFDAAADRRGVAECLDGLAGVAAAAGGDQLGCAARLFAAAESILAEAGAVLWASNRADHERDLNSLRASLEPAALQVEWARGRELTLEAAMAEARSLATTVAGS